MSHYGYLAHHGIKGQKWGHRNGPPYPLDASDHSAQEKRLNGGRYSQGVHQNRGGGGSSSSGGSGKRELTPEEKAERRKKILKRVAIGAGITAGVAATAAAVGGGVYAAKHPETVKAALANLKNKHLTNKELRAQFKTLKGGDGISKNDQKKFLKDAAKAIYKKTAKDNLKAGKLRDYENKMKKKGFIDVTSPTARMELVNEPWKISVNEKALREHHGNNYNKFVTGIMKDVNENNQINNFLANVNNDRKQSTGMRGALNKTKSVGKKVIAPAAAVAGGLGYLGNKAAQVNNGINNVTALANNKYVKNAMNYYLNDDYYDDNYYPEDSNKKKKNR